MECLLLPSSNLELNLWVTFLSLRLSKFFRMEVVHENSASGLSPFKAAYVF